MDELETKWPKNLGVISLLYALGGMLLQIVIVAVLFLLPILLDANVEIPLALKVIQISLSTVIVVAGMLMLVGAVNLLRRRRSGPSLLRAWVIVRLILIVLGLGAAIMLAPAQVPIQRAGIEQRIDALKDAGGDTSRLEKITDEDIHFAAIRNGVILSGVVAIYPFFLGFYLLRKKITAQVDHWE